MSRRFKPLDRLHGHQALASDPSAHAALSASAGTGKTHVLTARVLRLLLQGVAPESILCLTFTRAAAAEMANRIGARLASWARLGDNKLDAELFALGEERDPQTMDRARRLFASVLDAPGGLKIQTIHAFSQALLGAFPAEAGIGTGIEPLDQRREEELARKVLAHVAASAAEAALPASRHFLDDLKTLSLRLGEQGAQDYLRTASRHIEAMETLWSDDEIEAQLRTIVGLPEGDLDAFLAQQCHDEHFDRALCEALVDANRAWDTKTGDAVVDRISDWLAKAPQERSATFQEMAKGIVTQKGEASKQQPDAELAARLAERIGELAGLKARATLVKVQAAGLRAGRRFALAYADAKRRAGVADFDDLIRWTRRLLAQPGIGDWVRYKLDHRIDHVLVDEAQDNNRSQWDIVERITDEYMSGSAEADDDWRTLFMVGDFKQAIYGFQGADPEGFVAMRQALVERAKELAEAAGPDDHPRAFRDLDISKSFRSAPAILRVTDEVIAQVGHETLGLPRNPPLHEAARPDDHGRVELWPAFSVTDDEDGDDDEGEEGWVDLRDRKFAEKLADAIKGIVDGAGGEPPVPPGHILVLLRKRSELASLIVARLYSADVPVAGVDRLFLSKPLAVRDLIAAMAFSSQPDDDLTLACLLTSPLIGWTQEQLYDLAKARGDKTLWRVLRDRKGEGGHVSDAHTHLSHLLADADYLSPSAFLEKILSGSMRGRAKLLARLGFEARDPIEELVSSALDFEADATATLDQFLAAMRRGEVEVKREAGEAGNAVRVMTVHGAKGLEAPVVILADATADPERMGMIGNSVVMKRDGLPDIPFIRPRKDEACEPFATFMEENKLRERQEHWRLLYVALTRAARRLIVTGTAPKDDKPVPPQSWHSAVQRALVGCDADALDAPWGEGGLMIESGHRRAGKAQARRAAQNPARPSWLDAPAPVEARPPRPLAPSAPDGEDEEVYPPPAPGDRAAARRGILIHALLERLPPVDRARRRDVGLRWLETSAGIGEKAQRVEMVDAALDVIDHPDYAELFGPGSLAEAPIAAVVDEGRVVAGTADRLLVTDDVVHVIDYKTGRSVPADRSDVPAAHIGQMRAYTEALRVIFPGRAVRASLLYTAGPRLIALGG